MTKLVVHCDCCKAKMRWVTGVNCFAERYSRYECTSCGNAQDVTMAHLMTTFGVDRLESIEKREERENDN
jgi:hypothetical protein